MIRMGLLAASLVVLAGCGRPEENQVTPVQTMAASAGTAADREVHAKLETATFAVG